MSDTIYLDSKQASIVRISALTATGNMEELKKVLNKGLDEGLMINEIKEILVQLYAYCGFPRSLNGLTALMSVVDERKTMGITDAEGETASHIREDNKYQSGKKNLQTLTGRRTNACRCQCVCTGS